MNIKALHAPSSECCQKCPEGKKRKIDYHRIWSIALIIGSALWLIPFLMGEYADSSYSFIQMEDIPKFLVGRFANGSDKDFCPPISPHVKSDLNFEEAYKIMDNDLFANDFDSKFAELYNVQNGGIWQPMECVTRYEVALVIPYRNRYVQLRKFLRYIHPFLQRQQIHYRIFVVEQDNELLFNRAKLMNIGFVEALKSGQPDDCFIFHDVDLLPLSDLNIYACTHNPRHLYSSSDNFRFHLPYRRFFGGVVAFLGNHFRKINGCSNLYFGWGGEDDDLAARVYFTGLDFVRFDPAVSGYVMQPHVKETPSSTRWKYYYMDSDDFSREGLSTLTYRRTKIASHPLYTHIHVTW